MPLEDSAWKLHSVTPVAVSWSKQVHKASPDSKGVEHKTPPLAGRAAENLWPFSPHIREAQQRDLVTCSRSHSLGQYSVLSALKAAAHYF